MNKQTTTFFVACVMAFIVMFVYERAGSTNVPAPTVPVVAAPEHPKDTVPVVIAKGDLEQYIRLTPQHVTTKDYPIGLVPLEATVNTSDVIGKEVLEEIFKGEFITLKRLQDPGETQGGLSSELKPGERALTISVDAGKAAGGFIQQGDVVDVVAQFPASGGDEKTKTVLSNVKVLAVGGDYLKRLRKNPDQLIRGGGAQLRITMAVTSEMAGKIHHLGKRTVFNLILKNPKDTSDIPTEGWSFSKLLKEHLPPELNPTVKKVEKQYQVTVISGLSQTKQSVNVETEAPVSSN